MCDVRFMHTKWNAPQNISIENLQSQHQCRVDLKPRNNSTWPNIQAYKNCIRGLKAISYQLHLQKLTSEIPETIPLCSNMPCSRKFQVSKITYVLNNPQELTINVCVHSNWQFIVLLNGAQYLSIHSTSHLA